MENWSPQRIRELSPDIALRGMVANEIGCARISMMARSMSSKERPDTLVQDHTPALPFSLATHGGSIHIGATSDIDRHRRGMGRSSMTRRRLSGSPIVALREQQDVVHSITSSAATSSVCGIVSPSSFAVLRLMINSNLVGCSTGRSLGLAPRKILSTYSAARWNRVGMLAP